jgi:hypothetical protein
MLICSKKRKSKCDAQQVSQETTINLPQIGADNSHAHLASYEGQAASVNTPMVPLLQVHLVPVADRWLRTVDLRHTLDKPISQNRQRHPLNGRCPKSQS